LEVFYNTEFDEVAAVCGCNPKAAELVHSLKAKGIRVILATNPLFPRIATQKRIRWAGLQPEDFEFYTTFEDIGYCKPNPDYYREVLRRGGLDAADCLMVGNDVAEDMMAGAKVGLRGFLLTDCLINKGREDIDSYPHGSYPELITWIRGL
jgi:HAD superfamily hydrolase (TIGR01509 family)